MRSLFFHFAIILLLFTQNTVRAEEPSRILQQDLGRNYGLLVGDIIHHSYIIEVDSSYALTPSSLPVAGDLSYWLELLDVDFSSTDRGEKTLYRLDMTYQTFYAPLDVRTLYTPAIQLDFSNEQNQKISMTLERWPFTMSPIKEISPSAVGTETDISSFMKASIVPKFVNERSHREQMLIYAGLFAVTLLALIIMSGWLPGLNRSPFIRAQQKIRKLRKRGQDLQTSQACLQAVHEAINQRAGNTVFASQLDAFLTLHPQFKPLEAKLRDFYQQSQDCFFLGKPASDHVIDDCIKLCGQLANADKVKVTS